MELKKIIIAMPAEEDFMPSISRWANEYDWSNTEAHFVHVVKQNFEITQISVIEVPDNKMFQEMKPKIVEYFLNKAKNFMPPKAFANASFEVFCDQSPAERMVKYANEIDAKMVVVATRNKKGLAGFFTSSFADRMLSLSPCDILVLRPEKKA